MAPAGHGLTLGHDPKCIPTPDGRYARRPMRLVAAALAVSAALALGACGAASTAGEFEGEEETVATVVADLQSESEKGEATQICENLLTEALQEKVAAGSDSCASELDKALEDADAFELEVQDVSISGTTATAKVKGVDEDDAGIVRTVELEKVGDDWRIDSFGS